MDYIWRRSNSGEPGNPGKFGTTAHTEDSELRLPRPPQTALEWSRRAIVDVVGNVLAPQRNALTLVGAHAVILRTSHLDVAIHPTGDGDFGVTPSLVLGEPLLSDLMAAAGFEPRTDSRPGLWGRGRRESPGGKVDWQEQIDLITGEALTGNTRKGKRSVAALSTHGRSVGSTAGIELSAFDRSLMAVDDFVDPTLSVEVNVAGFSALICAKSYKLGERLADGGRRLREKDGADLWRLLECADRDVVAETFRTFEQDPRIGASVTVGRGHIASAIRAARIRQLTKDAFERQVTTERVDKTFDSWLDVFPLN